MLFPPLEPYACGMLPLDDLHLMYWEQCGRPDGVPVLYLHGGPGDGCSPACRQLFDPSFYRAVLFDQRGCGRSIPRGEIRNNTTAHLLDDIEQLREHLGIERWLVYGGSWGSTLALAYAEAHPQRVSGLVLRGVFLGRDEEIDWFLSGMGRFFPEAAQRFVAPIPEAVRGDFLQAYYQNLTDHDPEVHLAAARQWAQYESSCATLLPNREAVARASSEFAALPLARLEAHYFIHRLFLPHNQLLKNIERIRHIPGIIVQGRYDVVCPPKSAYDLAQAWPKGELVLVEGAGHSLWEPGILQAVLHALTLFKARLA